VAEPMRLELYFAADRGFEDVWRSCVSKAADTILAHHGACELAGAPRAERIVVLAGDEDAEPVEGLENAVEFNNRVPWAAAIPAGADTVAATFSLYVTIEVQRRLDLRSED
jgi:hypothetical protein